jgi:hypothetical protein
MVEYSHMVAFEGPHWCSKIPKILDYDKTKSRPKYKCFHYVPILGDLNNIILVTSSIKVSTTVATALLFTYRSIYSFNRMILQLLYYRLQYLYISLQFLWRLFLCFFNVNHCVPKSADSLGTKFCSHVLQVFDQFINVEFDIPKILAIRGCNVSHLFDKIK